MARKILVLSGKGGVGKSTVTVCLACALTALSKKVLAIDADIGFRSLDLLLGAGDRVVYNWADVIDSGCDRSEAPVLSANGVALLAAPSRADSDMTAESFSELLRGYDGDYDYILIDAPAGSGELHSMLAKACDEAILTVTPDPVCVRSAEVAINRALEANEQLKTMLIINRLNRQEVLSGRQLKLDDAVDATRTRLIGVIPESDSVRLLSSGEKLTKYASSAFERTAKRLEGRSIPFRIKDFY